MDDMPGNGVASSASTLMLQDGNNVYNSTFPSRRREAGMEPSSHQWKIYDTQINLWWGVFLLIQFTFTQCGLWQPGTISLGTPD